jgi:hypothetical protein
VTDFGTKAERDAALCVALACKELNTSIRSAADAGVNVRIIELSKEWDAPSELQVARMERRVMILPTALKAVV